MPLCNASRDEMENAEDFNALVADGRTGVNLQESSAGLPGDESAAPNCFLVVQGISHLTKIAVVYPSAL